MEPPLGRSASVSKPAWIEWYCILAKKGYFSANIKAALLGFLDWSEGDDDVK